mmetsp:Transcript_9762/g.30579  ORF Transcript_9762/g.30579 Transcript_9762/m.30579 type:complete len:268 (-) Transcript_9762:134-937(-)
MGSPRTGGPRNTLCITASPTRSTRMRTSCRSPSFSFSRPQRRAARTAPFASGNTSTATPCSPLLSGCGASIRCAASSAAATGRRRWLARCSMLGSSPCCRCRWRLAQSRWVAFCAARLSPPRTRARRSWTTTPPAPRRSTSTRSSARRVTPSATTPSQSSSGAVWTCSLSITCSRRCRATSTTAYGRSCSRGPRRLAQATALARGRPSLQTTGRRSGTWPRRECPPQASPVGSTRAHVAMHRCCPCASSKWMRAPAAAASCPQRATV